MEILNYARVALPREAVGIIGAKPVEGPDLVIPLPNLAAERAFLADPIAQYDAFRLLDQNGYDLLAIYHSHPGGGIHPSSSDIAWGSLWECAHIIIALPLPSNFPGQDQTRMGAWRFGLTPGDCRSVPIIIR